MQTRRLIALSFIAALALGSSSSWAQQPTYGGTLRVALPADVTFFNAHQGPAPGHFTLWVWNNLFNSLLTITPPPESQIVPDLAKSWEVLDAGQTYVFHLQEGVTFHDGTAFDAHAAKWNFERILDPEVGSWVRPYYEDIEQVEAVDTYTLRVRMKERSGAFLTVLAGYFQGIPMASPTSFATHGKDWVRHPSGTGPFKLQDWVPGEHIILEKNPTYFKKGLPYLDQLEFRVIRNEVAAAAALRAGEVDFISRLPLPQVFGLEKTPGTEVLTGPAMAPSMSACTD